MAELASANEAVHFPVMLPEVLEYMAPKAGGVYVDGTFGAGGYSGGILESANCDVIAIDRDPSVRHYAHALSAKYGDRFRLLEGCFGDMQQLLAEEGCGRVDGIVLDIGVSSMQLDQAERGFSFRQDGPLDMRMSGQGESAADLVNGLDETELANVIYRYGEERKSRAIARAIVKVRGEAPIATTGQLQQIIHSVIYPKQGQIDPATRTFQALRIKVNDELGELERALAAVPELLKKGGRLVVVTFHSLEDRIVKQVMREWAGKQAGASRHDLAAQFQHEASAPARANMLTRKAVTASESELARNPRSRSAKLRAVEWCDAAV